MNWRTTRRARKLHRCAECGAAIRPGSYYVDCRGVDVDGFRHWRHCLWCEDMWAHFHASHNRHGWWDDEPMLDVLDVMRVDGCEVYGGAERCG